MAEITITVAKNGSTQVSVNGIPGSSCTEITKNIEAALGQVSDRHLTSEYYQEAQDTHVLESRQ